MKFKYWKFILNTGTTTIGISRYGGDLCFINYDNIVEYWQMKNHDGIILNPVNCRLFAVYENSEIEFTYTENELEYIKNLHGLS